MFKKVFSLIIHWLGGHTAEEVEAMSASNRREVYGLKRFWIATLGLLGFSSAQIRASIKEKMIQAKTSSEAWKNQAEYFRLMRERAASNQAQSDSVYLLLNEVLGQLPDDNIALTLPPAPPAPPAS